MTRGHPNSGINYTCKHNVRHKAHGLCSPCYETARPKRPPHPATNRTKDRNRLRLLKYNLTPEQYVILLTNQNNACAICKHPLIPGQRTQIDHNHKTNEVRGLLCGQCNNGLGLFHEDLNHLVTAVNYLDYPPARSLFEQTA